MSEEQEPTIEDRVQNALDSFNRGGDYYDYRPTHYNADAYKSLRNTVELYRGGIVGDAEIKAAIREYRDRCEVGSLDFDIRQTEPPMPEMRRMSLLFGYEIGRKTTARLDAEQRTLFRAAKLTENLRLVIDCKQPITDKVRQQCTGFVVKMPAHVVTPELLTVINEIEVYNPYHKRLTELPVTLTKDRPDELFMAAQSTDAAAETGPGPLVTPGVTDNGAFEARLGELPLKSAARAVRKSPPRRLGYTLPTGEIVVERPEEIFLVTNFEKHEEFAAYCDELHEKIYGANNGANNGTNPANSDA